ncbi:hypothetical protein FGIG_06085 [Fasciola gigantica]|uniref:Uncharacterized protein n=1 Tax=Fasciola gigantica TaxID=46835 RepID=A0A504YJN0_FASGI|nr:hypothetical protein FGIG_06085 [Fasciola gigantica]
MLLAKTAGSVPTSLISLPVPELYHRAVECVQQLTAEMLNSSVPPILPVDNFLIELDHRLRRTARTASVPFRRPVVPNGDVTKAEVGKPQILSGPSGSSRSVYLLRRSCGFESRDEAQHR